MNTYRVVFNNHHIAYRTINAEYYQVNDEIYHFYKAGTVILTTSVRNVAYVERV